MTIQMPWLKHSNHSAILSEITSTQRSLENNFLDSWIDGILILTKTGQCIHSNNLGKSLCDRIAQDYPSTDLIPQEIWHTCQILIHNRQGLPRHLIIAESELKLKRSHEHVRIRARWLNNTTDPHILVILENLTQSRQTLAITETIKYKLSPREADVWSLHRIGYTYQEIAAELHIALNTVKKHMKNAYAKQQLFTMIDESYTDGLAG
ncbi:MAG: LuxR C-terminal-related transcriptional regulator [Cyanobacteria bacterium P01_H01_bin.21]